MATDPDHRSRLWTARHNAYFACLQLRPGSRSINTDGAPISRLAEHRRDRSGIEGASMPIPLLGHVVTAISIC
jgi:D-lactate dehydrogenase (cytochrome)